MRHCAICYGRADEAHHYTPRSRGGTETIDLCNRCHRAVTNEERWATYLLRKALEQRGRTIRLYEGKKI